MRFLTEVPFLVLATMIMPGGFFLRRTSAFVLSRSPPRTFAAPALLQVRGGHRNSNWVRPATVEVEATTVNAIEKEAKASLSIVGSSVSLASIQGVPYLDSKDCKEFRVLFVLGGPGAGESG